MGMCGDYPAPHNLHKTIPRRTTAYPTPDLTFPHRITITMHPSHLTPHRITSHNISSQLSPYPFHSITSLYISLTIPPSPLIPSHPIRTVELHVPQHPDASVGVGQISLLSEKIAAEAEKDWRGKKGGISDKINNAGLLVLMSMIDYDSTDKVSFVISFHVKLYNIILYRMNVSPSHTNLFWLQLIQSPILCCPHHSPSSLYTPPLSDTISSSSLLLPILTLSL